MNSLVSACISYQPGIFIFEGANVNKINNIIESMRHQYLHVSCCY
jgi:hypothetical protein